MHAAEPESVALLDPGDPPALAARAAAALERRVGTAAAVVGRAPGRVVLIGDHTDHSGGACLPLALPHATYAAARSRRDGRVTVSSDVVEGVVEARLDDVSPGRVEGWSAYVLGTIWALREAGWDVPGCDLALVSTVPVGAGLSSSAALEVAVAAAVARLVGTDLADAGVRDALVAACRRAENEVVGAPTGGMDQAVAVHADAGAALLLDFADAAEVRREQVPLDLAGDGLALLVTDTRVAHALVDGEYAVRRRECAAAASALGVEVLAAADLAGVDVLDDPLLRRRARHVVTESARVHEVAAAAGARDWAAVGRAMVASHASLRDGFEVSCAELDLVVEAALAAGALGGRMTGGGFGGSVVALVREDGLEEVADAVDRAAAAAGHPAPVHLRGVPAAGAGLVEPGPGW